jgi:hypothetical protein
LLDAADAGDGDEKVGLLNPDALSSSEVCSPHVHGRERDSHAYILDAPTPAHPFCPPAVVNSLFAI